MGAGEPSTPEWLELDPDERILVRATPSSNLVLAGLIVGVSLMLTMSVVVGFFTDITTGRVVSFVILVLIVVIIAGAFLVTKRREYVVTTERACAAIGLTGKTITECSLDRVRDVTIDQSGWQQLVNVGDLTLVTEDGTLEFSLVEHPAHLVQRILGIVDIDVD